MTLPGDEFAPMFITPEELNSGALREVVSYFANDRAFLLQVCVAASQDVEDRCDRRMLPFYDIVETDRAHGVDPDGAGLGDGTPILGLQGAIGLSEARAYGFTQLVRDLWVKNYPPKRQELWTYDAASIKLRPSWGGEIVLDNTRFHGPEPDTGHIKLALGTLCPPGTDYEITYSGGYTLGVPAALKEAARWIAVRRLILEVEPDMRTGPSLGEIDREITGELAGYAR